MTKTFALLVCLLAPLYAAPDSGANLAVDGGTASFLVTTNVPAISVKGKSTALQARVRMERNADGLHLAEIEASMPVSSIATGMSLRDEHMRRYIFTTGDGKTPDLRFEAHDGGCSAPAGKNNETVCQISGTLAIRGIARPFSMPLKVRADGSAFRAAGDGIVKLSDYGIEQPSQFGVKTSNEIQLHLEFTGKETLAAVASRGRQ